MCVGISFRISAGLRSVLTEDFCDILHSPQARDKYYKYEATAVFFQTLYRLSSAMILPFGALLLEIIMASLNEPLKYG
jgi:hypothetical protein